MGFAENSYKKPMRGCIRIGRNNIPRNCSYRAVMPGASR